MKTIEDENVQEILLELVESIFKYERESGNRIIDYGRQPELIVKIFIENYKEKHNG
jgi:hypothetical protein